MAIIVPNNELYLLRGVRLSINDHNTIYWSSQSAQESYFKSKAVHSEQDITYCYVGDGYLEIDGCSEDFTGVNYMMFRNTEYGSRWWYAYVTSIEFDSGNSATVHFEIDEWQTYFFDFQNNACMVLREHVSDDTIGKHLKSEPVNLGNPNIESIEYAGVGARLNTCIVLSSTFDPTSESFDAVDGGVYGGIYSGLKLTPYSIYDDVKINDLNTALKSANANNKQNGIVDLFAYPESFFPSGDSPVSKEYTYNKQYGDFDGYTPHNNKLYVYPFNYLVYATTTGQQRELRFELFSESSCRFLMFGSPYNTPQIVACPILYNNPDGSGNAANLTEKLTLEGFPHFAYNVDVFKAYLAQHGGAMSIQMLAGALGSGVAALSGNPLGLAAAGGAVAGLGQQAANLMALSDKAPEMKGSSSGGALAGYGLLDFMFYTVRVNREMAESIDEYFDVYGYEVDEVKVPNFTGRPNVNYVKVAKSTLTGNIPSQILSKMRADLEQGMWFWQVADQVGNFAANNKLS